MSDELREALADKKRIIDSIHSCQVDMHVKCMFEHGPVCYAEGSCEYMQQAKRLRIEEARLKLQYVAGLVLLAMATTKHKKIECEVW